MLAVKRILVFLCISHKLADYSEVYKLKRNGFSRWVCNGLFNGTKWKWGERKQG